MTALVPAVVISYRATEAAESREKGGANIPHTPAHIQDPRCYGSCNTGTPRE